MKKANEDLCEGHELFLLLLEDIKIPFNRSAEAFKGSQINSKTSVQTHEAGEYYYLTCFRHLSRLRAIPKRLELSLALMKQKPTSSFLKKTDIHRTEYIEHNFSNYIFTLVSSRDIAYMSVNAVLNLGLDARQTNNQTITNNFWVKEFQIDVALKAFDKVVNQYSQDRNLLAHQGETPKLSAMDMIGMMDASEHILAKVGKKPIFDAKTKQKLIDEAIETEIGQFIREIGLINEATKGLLDKLLPVYKFWKQQPPGLRSPKITFKYERK